MHSRCFLCMTGHYNFCVCMMYVCRPLCRITLVDSFLPQLEKNVGMKGLTPPLRPRETINSLPFLPLLPLPSLIPFLRSGPPALPLNRRVRGVTHAYVWRPIALCPHSTSDLFYRQLQTTCYNMETAKLSFSEHVIFVLHARSVYIIYAAAVGT